MAKGKRKRSDDVEELTVITAKDAIPAVRSSSDPPPKKRKWTNKQRVLVLASRGINSRERHLLNNIKAMLPHSKPESKMEKKDSLVILNEIAVMKNCNKCIYFESKKHSDTYAWFSNSPNGPSAKFLVENIHTMEELKLTGNCLKGSRAILSFDKKFDEFPQYSLLKELFTQIFGVPYHHPKSQPFIDHVYTFTILDRRIWFRNYQIVEEDGSLAEIGPRFTLNPIKIFDGSFCGSTLWDNMSYVSPNQHRRVVRQQARNKFQNRIENKVGFQKRKLKKSFEFDDSDAVFRTLPKNHKKYAHIDYAPKK